MKEFLGKYQAVKLETSKDEGKLTLESAKKRILHLLIENIRNFKEDNWNTSNRMNKLMMDTEQNSVFTLRLGGKKILRYSLDLLDTAQKMQFLADFHTSVANGEFDEEIVAFLAREIENSTQRKKEGSERRRLKRLEERAKRAEATRQTLAAAEPLLNHELMPNISLFEQL